VFSVATAFSLFFWKSTNACVQGVLIDFTLERLNVKDFFSNCHLEPLFLQENSCFLRPALGEPTYRLLTVETVSIKEKIDRY
jgi:hypothetical protein